MAHALIADHTINFSLDERNKQRLKAHLKHAMLFEEKIILSDSDVLANRNLRNLLYDEGDFRELFTKENFVVAIRSNADFRRSDRKAHPKLIRDPSLEEVLRTFDSFGKFGYLRNTDPERDLYKRTAELDSLEKKVDIQRYDVVQIGRIYTDQIISLFQSDRVRAELGDEMASLIYQGVLTERELNKSDYNLLGGIGTVYFDEELPAELARMGMQKKWTEVAGKVFEIARAPYLTAFARAVSASPIYTRKHESRLDYMRSIDPLSRSVCEPIRYKTSVSDYEQGIIYLPSSAIHKLRETSEFKSLRKAINNFSGTQSSVNDILEYLIAYKRQIDNEIVLHSPYLKLERPENNQIIDVKELLIHVSTAIGMTINALSVSTISTPVTDIFSLGLGFFNIFFQPFLNRQRKAEELRQERQRDDLEEILKNDKENNRIDIEFGLQITDHDHLVDTEIIYKSGD
jgi:hypothetical protein